MHITITEEEYQELMRVKREYETIRIKLKGFKDALDVHYENGLRDMAIVIVTKELEELLK